VQILPGAVVLAAVLLIGLGRGRRGGRVLAAAGVTVLVFVAAAAAWWLVRLDPLLPFDRHAASTRALWVVLLWAPPGVLAALAAAWLTRAPRLQ
jgi:hypothetical protein